MVKKIEVAALGALSLMLAACVEESGTASVTPGRATVAQVEQTCIARLASQSGVFPAEIIVTESMGSSEGTVAFLRDAKGAPWVCRADGAGNITQLYQGES